MNAYGVSMLLLCAIIIFAVYQTNSVPVGNDTGLADGTVVGDSVQVIHKSREDSIDFSGSDFANGKVKIRTCHDTDEGRKCEDIDSTKITETKETSPKPTKTETTDTETTDAETGDAETTDTKTSDTDTSDTEKTDTETTDTEATEEE